MNTLHLTLKLFIVVGFSLTTTRTLAQKAGSTQNNSSHNVTIKGIGKPYSNKISLRWNIDRADKMDYLAQTGVVIDRLIIDKNSKPQGNWQRITPAAVKAFTKEQLLSDENKKDTGMAAIYKCLYEPSKFPATSLFEDIKNREMDAENRYLILAFYAAQKPKYAIAAGLGLDDYLTVDSTKSYVYRIGFENNNKTISKAFIYIYGKLLNAKIYFNEVKASGNDQSITLKWNSRETRFNAYWIERSTDGINFSRINKLMYLPALDTTSYDHYYADSVKNYVKYQYRLQGLNSFGEYTVSNITTPVFARDLTPPEMPFLQAELKKNKINLKWSKPENRDLDGYYILFGKGTNKTDSLLSVEYFKPNITSYSFEKPEKFKFAYYRILAVDTAKNYSYSNSSYVFESDQVPPEPPHNLYAEIDTLGIVSLNWAFDSTDAIIGYKVFFANQEDHVFTAVSNIIKVNEFTDTVSLKSLSEYIYYKVVAIDQNYNHSKMSAAIKVHRPDTIPPPEPVILNYAIKKSKITIYWSDLNITDLKKYKIFRKKAGDKDYLWLGETLLNSFTDSMNLLSNTAYQYSITAIDHSGLNSLPSFPVTIRTAQTTPDENIAIQRQAENEQLYLIWNASSHSVARYLIYEKKNGFYTNTSSVSGTQNRYLISKENEKTGFAIKILYTNGAESELITEK